jgi:hypothetical protein
MQKHPPTHRPFSGGETKLRRLTVDHLKPHPLCFGIYLRMEWIHGNGFDRVS